MNTRRRRWPWFVVGAVAAASLFIWWVPWEFDWVPRPYPQLPRNSAAEKELLEVAERILVITAHPDDSEFYAASTLSMLSERGAKITLVVVTDGDKGYYPFGEDVERNRKVRRAEQERATAAWGGIETRFLSFPDGRVSPDERLQQVLASEIKQANPQVIITFDAEYPRRLSHGDHRAVGRAVRSVAAGIPIYGMETGAPDVLVDTASRWSAKQKMLLIHASQFAQKQDFIFELVTSREKEAGEKFGLKRAEGFRLIQDPVR